MQQKYLNIINILNLKIDLFNFLKEKDLICEYTAYYFLYVLYWCPIQYVKLGHFRNNNSLNLQTELSRNIWTQWIKYL